VTTFDGRAADHVMKFPRPSPSVFAYCKRSKTGGVEGLGTRLNVAQLCFLTQTLLLHYFTPQYVTKRLKAVAGQPLSVPKNAKAADK